MERGSARISPEVPGPNLPLSGMLEPRGIRLKKDQGEVEKKKGTWPVERVGLTHVISKPSARLRGERAAADGEDRSPHHPAEAEQIDWGEQPGNYSTRTRLLTPTSTQDEQALLTKGSQGHSDVRVPGEGDLGGGRTRTVSREPLEGKGIRPPRCL